MDRPIGEKCANCTYYFEPFCKRFPPQPMAVDKFYDELIWKNVHPNPGQDNWCGEWRQK